ncbi:DUF6684 family protein [Natribaculum luteum]|uniref:DUF6684 family protein n=1 Tax=Natribaculum luteum TaxID=1586232 RepID=A0ABD5NY02_9EURY|nr:DUF6684 family protein [Natribaculum luteum]
MDLEFVDTETALDVAVNLFPLSIILFFVAVFAVFNPWGIDPLQSLLQFAILGSMVVALAITTYYVARAIEG